MLEMNIVPAFNWLTGEEGGLEEYQF